MVDELLAARGITISHETVRQWARKFGQAFANQIRRRLPRAGGKWHLEEVEAKIAGHNHGLWRDVDQTGMALDVLVQSRRDKRAAKRLLRKLLKKQMRASRVQITDKQASYGAAKGVVMPSIEHRRRKSLNNRSESFHQPTRAADQAVHVSQPSPTLPPRSRSGQQLISPPPQSPPRRPVSSRPDPGLSDLGRGHRHGHSGITVRAPSRSHMPSRA